jgi:DNA-cytosine methyltransferase
MSKASGAQLIAHRQTWPEAEIIAEPIRPPDEPRLLVRRRESDIVGSRGEQLIYLPGEPVISLFTGAGGLDLGLEQAGFTTVAQHEWDQAACLTLMANRPRAFRYSALIQGDIRKTPTTMLLQSANLRVGEAKMVAGGPPCQGFSTAGKRGGPERYDPRNDMVFEFLRVVREAQPEHFIFENVPGFPTFPGKVDGKEYLETFLARAYDSFYEIVYGMLDACCYGVPQHRVRFIAMGTRRDVVECDGIMASLPAMTHFSESDLVVLERPADTLFDLSTNWRRYNPGIRYFSDRPVLKPPAPTFDGAISKSHIAFYKNIEASEPDRIIWEPVAKAI